jgi:hypothetical protein
MIVSLCCFLLTIPGVQQEVFFAHGITLFCGLSSLSLDGYKDVALCIHEHIQEIASGNVEGAALAFREVRRSISTVDDLFMAGVEYVAQMPVDRLKSRQRRGGRPSYRGDYAAPEVVLIHCQRLNATDQRDYIHALLALNCCLTAIGDTARNEYTSHCIALSTWIDYGISVSQTFQQVTRYILNRDTASKLSRSRLDTESDLRH